jgi:UPF0716 protein FxsA
MVFLIFLALPLIEIALFILIGGAIGVGPTLLGVVLSTVFGSLIIRQQGLKLLAEVRETMGRGVLPARSLADAMLVSVAGALLVVPGYFTDILGLLLLVPPFRTLLYRFLGGRMRAMSPTPRPGWPGGPQGPRTIELDDDDFRQR